MKTKTEKHYLQSRVQCINWQCGGSLIDLKVPGIFEATIVDAKPEEKP